MKVKGCCGRVSPCKRLCVQSCRCPLGEARRALLLKQRRPAKVDRPAQTKGAEFES